VFVWPPLTPAPHRLMVDPISHLGVAVMHEAGCTWGTRAGGLSHPRQRPPAMFSAPLSGLWHEGVGLRLARRPSGPKRRRARAVADTTRSPARPHPQETRQIKPRQGRIRLSRWALARMRQAPGARTPRTSRSRRASHVPRLPRVRRANGRSGVALKMRSTFSSMWGGGPGGGARRRRMDQGRVLDAALPKLGTLPTEAWEYTLLEMLLR
jgi:hypothetical protein